MFFVQEYGCYLLMMHANWLRRNVKVYEEVSDENLIQKLIIGLSDKLFWSLQFLFCFVEG